MDALSNEELSKLVWGAVHNAGRKARSKEYRWVHVMDALGVGRTTAHELCEFYGLDPDERIGGEGPDE